MLFREIFKVLGNFLLYFTLILLVPFVLALYYQFIEPASINLQPNSSLEFFETILICLALAFIFKFLGRRAKGILYRKESIVIVVLIWLITALVSAIPFTLTKTLKNPLDAYFESMSGLTTTGATTMCAKAYKPHSKEEILKIDSNIHVPTKTYKYYGTITPVRDKDGKIILTGVEAVSKAVIFWRSFIQWLGGMGIVILFLAILPALSVGGKYLYQMEVPGPTKDAVTPRIKDTASILWKLYLGLTILQVVLLLITNSQVKLLDAFCITFSTLSTGGYSIKNASIGAYNSAWTDWIVIIFMFLGSVNFALYFYIIRRKFYKLYDPDLLLFIVSVILGSMLVSGFIIGSKIPNLTTNYTFFEAIRYGTFQAISAQSSTGFVTANYDIWPFPSQMFMFLLMYFGGMAGATCGGIKTSRFYILAKIIKRKIEVIFRPDVIRNVEVNKKPVDTSTQMTVLVFFCIVIFFSILGSVILVLDGIDPETSIGSIACMMNNIGLSFRAAGPTQSFAFFGIISKIVSIIWMLLGRLEFFAVLLLFIPGFWRKTS